MSITAYAHGAAGAVAVQGYASTAATPTSLVTLNVIDWDGTVEYKEHDTSNTGVTGWDIAQKGKGKWTFTIHAQLQLNSAGAGYNQAVNPISVNGPDLQADYAYIELIGGTTPAAGAVAVTTPAATANELFRCNQCIITSFKITNKNDDVIDYVITGRNGAAVVINGAS